MQLLLKEAKRTQDGNLVYIKIKGLSIISMCIKDKFGSVPMLILLTQKKLDHSKNYAVTYLTKDEEFCMFYGCISNHSLNKKLTKRKTYKKDCSTIQVHYKYILNPVPNPSNLHANKFKDIHNPDTKHRFFKYFPSHILSADGNIKDLSIE